jgi:hypothetical protein
MPWPSSSRNPPQRVTPYQRRPSRSEGPEETDSSRAKQSRISAAASLLTTALGIAMVGIAVWGLWVSGDVVRYGIDGRVVPGKDNLNALLFLLSWLVLFGPFLYFGVVILRFAFTPEKRSWLVSLRVFTYIVGLRARAEMENKDFRSKSAAKTLPAPGTAKSRQPLP